MNGTQHRKIKKEADVNERKFFLYSVRTTKTIITSFGWALPENIALGLQRYFDCGQYFPLKPSSRWLLYISVPGKRGGVLGRNRCRVCASDKGTFFHTLKVPQRP